MDKPRNLKTKQWGPSMWKTLHSITFGYPDKPAQACKTAYQDFFMSLKTVMPCSSCRSHYRKIIDAPKCKLSKRVFRDRTTLTRWLVRLHNTVNRKVKKPCLSYKKVSEQYDAWLVKKRNFAGWFMWNFCGGYEVNVQYILLGADFFLRNYMFYNMERSSLMYIQLLGVIDPLR